ncbi:hypothetical protein VSR68_10770 [Paraburkholderia phymatum]|uniref:hypothetical protein n=1 Tax=Paraburkholderia phymatum TaxID=148447 RepID=UPI003173D082
MAGEEIEHVGDAFRLLPASHWLLICISLVGSLRTEARIRSDRPFVRWPAMKNRSDACIESVRRIKRIERIERIKRIERIDPAEMQRKWR